MIILPRTYATVPLYLNMPKVEMTDQVCDGYRKTAKRITSREVRLIVDYLGEP